MGKYGKEIGKKIGKMIEKIEENRYFHIVSISLVNVIYKYVKVNMFKCNLDYRESLRKKEILQSVKNTRKVRYRESQLNIKKHFSSKKLND